MEELRIIDQCRKGQQQAQRRLYDEYSSRMLRLCERYLKDPAEAEDAFITAFQKAFENIGGFEYRGEGSFGKWLSTIMVNECLMLLRKSVRMEKVDVSEEVVIDHDPGYTDEEFIYGLILKLPVGYRTVFNLFVIEGKSHKEIAELLHISEGASKSQLSKARNLLKDGLIKNNLRYGNGGI